MENKTSQEQLIVLKFINPATSTFSQRMAETSALLSLGAALVYSLLQLPSALMKTQFRGLSVSVFIGPPL